MCRLLCLLHLCFWNLLLHHVSEAKGVTSQTQSTQTEEKSAVALHDCWRLETSEPSTLTSCLQKYLSNNYFQNNQFNLERIRHGIKGKSKGRGRGEITLAVCYSHHIESYAAIAAFVNAAYASTRGYDLKLLTLSRHDYFPQDRRWNKIAAVLDAFHTSSRASTPSAPSSSSPPSAPSSPSSLQGGWAQHADILVAMDADLIVTDFDKLDIMKLANKYETSHIIMSADAYDTANSGFIIVRNTQYAYDFMSTWYASRFEFDCDQHAFNSLYGRVQATSRHKKIVILPRVTLFVLATGDINSDTPLSSSFSPGSSKVLHLFGLPLPVRQRLFTVAARSVALTLSSECCLSAACRVLDRRGESTAAGRAASWPAPRECRFAQGLGIDGGLIRDALRVDVTARRERARGELEKIRHSKQEECVGAGAASAEVESSNQTLAGVSVEATVAVRATALLFSSQVLYEHFKKLIHLTSELCTGPEQLWKTTPSPETGSTSSRNINENTLSPSASASASASVSTTVVPHVQQCMHFFQQNVNLTKEFVFDTVFDFESVGTEVLAEAQNSMLEMMIDNYALGSTDASEIINTGREVLHTLSKLLEFSHQQKGNLNHRSVLFRIAASNHNLAQFCLRAQLFHKALEFSRQGVAESSIFMSSDFGYFPKFVSMHAALLSLHAQSLVAADVAPSDGQLDAMSASAMGIAYAQSLYREVHTEKNIYCGELFEHYFKRVQLVMNLQDEVTRALQEIDLLRTECHIEMNMQQRHLYAAAAAAAAAARRSWVGNTDD